MPQRQPKYETLSLNLPTLTSQQQTDILGILYKADLLPEGKTKSQTSNCKFYIERTGDLARVTIVDPTAEKQFAQLSEHKFKMEGEKVVGLYEEA